MGRNEARDFNNGLKKVLRIMQLVAGCSMRFVANGPVSAILMLRPRSGPGQWIMREEYILEPLVPVVEYTDGYGNLCQRLLIPQGPFQLCSSVYADTADVIAVLK
jgi:hypothetical protein